MVKRSLQNTSSSSVLCLQTPFDPAADNLTHVNNQNALAIMDYRGCCIHMTQFRRVVVAKSMQIEVNDGSAKRVRRKPNARQAAKHRNKAHAHHSHAARHQAEAIGHHEAGQHNRAAFGLCGGALGNKPQPLKN